MEATAYCERNSSSDGGGTDLGNSVKEVATVTVTVCKPKGVPTVAAVVLVLAKM